MFLKKVKKTHKGKVYETYALTESYREGGKVKHRNIASLGALAPERIQRMQLVLKAQRIDGVFVGHLSDVVAKQHFRFLDVAVLDDFWKQFGLDQFFAELPYAESMVVNRCLDPKSKINIKDWTNKTVLPRLHGSDHVDGYGVYRALDSIADREAELQRYLAERYRQLGITAGNTIFYDITSSYFEGTKCVLASFGYSRDHRPDRQQVVIALVVTPEGYPLYWQVLPGYIHDATTVKDLLRVLKDRLGIEQCLMVFDRGMVSVENLEAISAQNLTYVSALDKNEIPDILESDFQSLVVKDWKENLLARGFSVYDKNLVYREHVDDGKRFVLAFNLQLCLDQRQTRAQQIGKAEAFLSALNENLSKAGKSRVRDTTEVKVEKGLKRWGMKKIITWHLEPTVVSFQPSQGNARDVNTFRIVYSINQEALQEQGKMDGVFCFVTNDLSDNLTCHRVIGYYRRKNKIEEAFREIKSYLRLRPFYLTRARRVRAHVTICVLGYLLLNALEERLVSSSVKLSGPSTLEMLRECQVNRIGPHDSEAFVESITQLTKDQVEILNELHLNHLTEKKYLSKLLRQSVM